MVYGETTMNVRRDTFLLFSVRVELCGIDIKVCSMRNFAVHGDTERKQFPTTFLTATSHIYKRYSTRNLYLLREQIDTDPDFCQSLLSNA